jgi:ELWxxDGT repeat protein
VARGSLYFSADDGVRGYELWKTDGTETGTLLVKDIHLGPASTFSMPSTGAPIGTDGTLLFSAGDITHGVELWRTDGTEEGTALVKDINPGPSFSYPDAFLEVDGMVLFSAGDCTHGRELWRSDGTEEGTEQVQGIAHGVVESFPLSLTRFRNRIFFSADDGRTGREPWSGRAAILLGRPAAAVQDLKEEVKSLHLVRGVETSLLVMLDAAARALPEDQKTRAIVALENFVQHVNVLTPRMISEESAADLREFARDVVGLLEASSPTGSALRSRSRTITQSPGGRREK